MALGIKIQQAEESENHADLDDNFKMAVYGRSAGSIMNQGKGCQANGKGKNAKPQTKQPFLHKGSPPRNQSAARYAVIHQFKNCEI